MKRMMYTVLAFVLVSCDSKDGDTADGVVDGEEDRVEDAPPDQVGDRLEDPIEDPGRDPGEDASDADQEPGDGHWWERENLRVVTYEFLERRAGDTDLSVDEIMAHVDRVGGADVLLCKGFHYYEGVFDESSGGLPRFTAKFEEIVPVAHGRGLRTGIFGFVDRTKTYAGQEDYDKVLGVWGAYADMGADVLFVDEESGSSGLDIPAACLDYCDELKSRFGVPVGIFLYGAASGADTVGNIAAHVDIIGEMGYNLYLDQMGDYNLAHLTETWVTEARAANGTIAYWTGAGIFNEAQLPPSDFWQERYGSRSISDYFHDYLATGVESGATGVFFHSLCRLEWWDDATRDQVIDGVSRIFGELAAGP